MTDAQHFCAVEIKRIYFHFNQEYDNILGRVQHLKVLYSAMLNFLVTYRKSVYNMRMVPELKPKKDQRFKAMVLRIV